MKNIHDVPLCTGCRACEQLCPVQCIKFSTDYEGFIVPVIDEKRCIHCGKCYDSCPQAGSGYQNFRKVLHTYAGVHRDHTILMDSSSGGGMTALAQVILEQKGIVYGACLDTADWLVKYTGIEVENDLHQIRRSKYVQSDTGHSYYRIKQWLEAGRYVLFVGCPCQVAGLYACIGNDYKNLFTVDLLCHGVPSPRLFQEHVSYLEKKYKRKLVDFYFRDKMKFSNKIALRYIFRNKSVNILGKCEPYFKSFINGTAYRMCCYQCQYAQKQRVGDITLGDYWGIRKMHPEFDSTFGASLILVNTEKGKKLLSAANLKLKESDIEKAAAGNGILDRPSEMASCRKDFYQDIVKNGYLTTVRKNVKTLPAIYNGILSFLPREIIEKLSRIK